ncbi:hypothetical protein [Trichothermofontia sp.]
MSNLTEAGTGAAAGSERIDWEGECPDRVALARMACLCGDGVPRTHT